MTTAREVLDAAISEADFQAQVIDLAERCGWIVYSIPDSRRATAAGFPDCVLAHRERQELHFWELKAMDGRVSRAQRTWLAILWGAGLNVKVIKPSDWDEVERTLKGDR